MVSPPLTDFFFVNHYLHKIGASAKDWLLSLYTRHMLDRPYHFDAQGLVVFRKGLDDLKGDIKEDKHMGMLLVGLKSLYESAGLDLEGEVGREHPGVEWGSVEVCTDCSSCFRVID